MKTKNTIRDILESQRANKDLFEQSKAYAFDYMDALDDRPVFPCDAAVNNLDQFNESMPKAPCDPGTLLKMLHEFGSPATVSQTGGRYFGFVNGSTVPVAMAARWLSDIWDQNFALYVMSPVASHLEAICEKWLVELLGLPGSTAAGLVGGTSTATLCGIAAARNHILEHLGWDINKKGLFGAPPIRIVLGDQAHSSVFKGLSLLGFGDRQIEKVPADDQGRLMANHLPQTDDRTIVIAQAGNVNTGAFDPFDQICEAVKDTGAWVHIDGAFGLWSAGSFRKKHLVRGMENADSWSVDAHKTLNAPYDCGIILCKNKTALVKAMQATGSYIQYSDKRDGMLYTPEMSRRARSIELWATLKALGKNGVEMLVDRLCGNAAYFADQLKGKGFNILNEVVFNQVLVSCESPGLTAKTLDLIQQSGECWCGGAVWNDAPVIRVSVCSWVTTKADIDQSIDAFFKARHRAV